MRLPFDTKFKHFTRLKFLLDCVREVSLEGCCIFPPTLGFLEGGKDIIRSEVLKTLPRTVKYFFRGMNTGMFIKPVPEGELPLFTFMVEPVSMSGVLGWRDVDAYRLLVGG